MQILKKGFSIFAAVCLLLAVMPGVSPETVIYSIVNSVIDGGNVSEVQISINGDSSIVYQESIKLDEPLSRNQEMIKED